MRLIDADALKTVHGMRDDCAECDKEERRKSVKCEYDRVFTKMDFCGWLDDAPTVDAVPVVRCGECKHMAPTGRCREFADDLIRPSSSDFCSYGERREE